MRAQTGIGNFQREIFLGKMNLCKRLAHYLFKNSISVSLSDTF